jgi:hypothetical protein
LGSPFLLQRRRSKSTSAGSAPLSDDDISESPILKKRRVNVSSKYVPVPPSGSALENQMLGSLEELLKMQLLDPSRLIALALQYQTPESIPKTQPVGDEENMGVPLEPGTNDPPGNKPDRGTGGGGGPGGIGGGKGAARPHYF